MTAAGRQAPTSQPAKPPAWMHGLLRKVLKASAHLSAARSWPLAGGVSSDIHRVEVGQLTFCVKRALPKLKVAADWHAPVVRNAFEVAWMRTAAGIVPDAVPELLADDEAVGAFAMAWLPPERYPVWKSLLSSGTIDPGHGAAVGAVLGRLHAATADRAEVAQRFPTDALFEAIRLEPYLLATARRHEDLSGRLQDLAATTRAQHRVLVHGDFSPKNLLIGRRGPVVLDAECAWFGEPAFDLAFVLNHLLLKGAWRPRWRGRYRDVFAALVDAYRAHVDWEPWPGLEQRSAALLPALMLARIDGKSPVEYLDDDARGSVRAFARERVRSPPATLSTLVDDWSRA